MSVHVCVCMCVLMKLTNPLHPLQTRPDKQIKYACSAIFTFSRQWPFAEAAQGKYTLRLTNSVLLHALQVVQFIISGLPSSQGHETLFACYGAHFCFV